MERARDVHLLHISDGKDTTAHPSLGLTALVRAVGGGTRQQRG